jgi:hypothetical protein
MAFLLRSRHSRGVGLSAGNVPEGALAHLDFVSGVYFAGGGARLVASLLGGAFDPAAIGVNGMEVGANGNWPDAVGDLKSDIIAGLAGGMTVVVEWELTGNPPSANNQGPILALFDDTDPDLAGGAVILDTFPNIGLTVVDYASLFHQQADEQWNSITGNGQAERIAVTIARQTGGNYEYALSANGSASETDSVAYAPFTPVERVALFSVAPWEWYLDEAWVRTFTVYPAKLPAELPALSTIS